MEAAPPLRVVIVEDDARYRASLEQLFAHSDGFELAGSFAAPPAALKHVEMAADGGIALPWDIIVIDLDMPLMNGIEATRRLKAQLPDVKIVVLTVFEEPASILEAVCAGADGYLLKKARARELLDGLRSAVQGGAPLTADVAKRILDLVRSFSSRTSATSPAPARLDLTDRERDVLRSLVDGLSYKEVGESLGMSLGTVRSHVSAIYRKLQVHNAAEAVSRAVRQRLI